MGDAAQIESSKPRRSEEPGTYSYGRVRRSKADWCPSTMADAFKWHLEYFVRTPALELFYLAAEAVLKTVWRVVGHNPGTGSPAPIQLSPVYTTYPASLSCHAAIGLTAYLEMLAKLPNAGTNLLLNAGKAYFDNPAARDFVGADPEVYKSVIAMVGRWVQTRILLEEFSRNRQLVSMELYRLFEAAHQTTKFKNLTEIVSCSVLYDDVLPDWLSQKLHPITRNLLSELRRVNAPYVAQISGKRVHELIAVGLEWVRAIGRTLADFLPPPAGAKDAATAEAIERVRSILEGDGEPPRAQNARAPRVAPLDGPTPPSIFPATGVQDSIPLTDGNLCTWTLEGKPSGSPPAGPAGEILKNFSETLNSACAQDSTDDVRSDAIERELGAGGFSPGTVTGTPTFGHAVSLDYGDGKQRGGKIFDRALAPHPDPRALEKLCQDADPIKQVVRRQMFPNIRKIPESIRLRTTGGLDPARLALANVSSTVFRRYRFHERMDRRGKPLILLCADASGSLGVDQMTMLKLLTSGVLLATASTSVRMMAGLYHSGSVRGAVDVPLVQWLAHPRKTPGAGCLAALSGLAALPASGTGAQADALSLEFMLSEALDLANGDCVYMMVVTDACWNVSFRDGLSGTQEVSGFFKSAYARCKPGQLHSTLVVLGSTGWTTRSQPIVRWPQTPTRPAMAKVDGFDLVDALISIPANKLRAPAAVAQELGIHIAATIATRGKRQHRR